MWSLALGGVRLALVVVPLVYASIGVQRRVAPGATGAMAALLRVIIGLSICLVVLEVLGTVGLFSTGMIVAGQAVVGSVVALATGAAPWRRSAPRPGGSPDAATPPPTTLVGPGERLSVALTGLVVVAWVFLSWWIGRRGVLDNDSLRYHGPFVVRWLQRHSITHLHWTSNRLQETFFPANSELFSTLGFAAFRSDWLTPLLDVGWLAVALLAAWTMVDGRRRPYALVAVAAVAGSPLLLAWQPGSARNDIAAAALMLAAISIARWSEWRTAPMVIAGAAAGLAVGTKLSVLGPLAVVTVGLPLIAGRGRRLRTAVAFVGPMFVTGGFWYLRNWARTGNPLPWYRIKLGPISLPRPPFVFLATEGQSIADYAGSAHFWTHTVVDGLTHALGRAWPVFVAMGAAGVLLALRSRQRFPRLVAVAAVVGLVVDAFTPYSAGGLNGPNLFQSQLRFLTLVAILSLLAGVMVLEVSRLWIFPAITVVVLGIGLDNIPGYGWHVVGLVAVLALVVGVSLRPWSPLPVGRVLASGAIVAAVACVPFSQWYDAHRYLIPHHRGAAVAFAYFRHVHHARVAVGTLQHTYPLAGPDFSNVVQTVGSHGAHGAFWPAADCRTWQRLIDDGHYGYVVVGFAHHNTGPPPPEQAWTNGMGNARAVLHSGSTTVYRLGGSATGSTCPPARPPLSGARAPSPTGGR